MDAGSIGINRSTPSCWNRARSAPRNLQLVPRAALHDRARFEGPDELGHRHRAADDRVHHVHAGPWLRRMNRRSRRTCCCRPRRANYYAEFTIDGLLRGDSAARRAFYASALQNGWIIARRWRSKKTCRRRPMATSTRAIQPDPARQARHADRRAGRFGYASRISWASLRPPEGPRR